MTNKEAIERLTKLGFNMGTVPEVPHWGTIDAEPFMIGKDHFTPSYRDVFIGVLTGGFYITSHILGKMRKYRCRTFHSTHIANIFAWGKTLDEAITQFEYNFTNQVYNNGKTSDLAASEMDRYL